MKYFSKLVMCFALLLTLSYADSITLRDGRRLQGKYVGGNSSAIGFVINGAIQYFPVPDVLTVMFSAPDIDSPLGGFQPNSLHAPRNLVKPKKANSSTSTSPVLRKTNSPARPRRPRNLGSL